MISIIVPTLNEEIAIPETLKSFVALEGNNEIIVSDGGSHDRTVALALSFGVRVVHSDRGRGVQMHTGAKAACGDIFWFVHADVVAPSNALQHITRALDCDRVVGGNFGVMFDGSSRAAKQATFIYPLMRAVNCCYGDSGIFVRRRVYETIGGFRPLEIFEDLDLLRRIRQTGKFVHLSCRVIASSRRFENRNFWGMCAHWSAMQVLYWCGVDPNRLAQHYNNVRRQNAAGATQADRAAEQTGQASV
jgi:rSAM/selenodomain-associated transferase 2